nr:uncharacterized protein LOC117692240 isoform X2 [Crassostrea gigas]
MKYKQRFSLIVAFCCYSALLLLTENCPLSHKIVDDCGNVGFLWNCSGFNISKLPTAIPPELENGTVTLDLSFNLFCNLTEDTFQQIAAYSNVTSVILHHNNITKIENLTFRRLENLCSLDLSFTFLEKSKIDTDAFSNLDKLKILRIHQNNFQGLGYPDIQLSKIHSLKYLKIDIFSGFAFTKPFENLTSLSQLEFEILNDFELTNASFQGLRLSPIHSINMDFSNYVPCDVTEDLFCSFPYLNESIRIDFGGVSQSEEIIKCINESRKVMFIISESFLDIGWSSYAVQMAITHAFHNQRQRSIVVIIKDGLPLERLPKEFKHIWWCIEHLRWPEDETNEETLLLNLSNVLVSE